MIRTYYRAENNSNAMNLITRAATDDIRKILKMHWPYEMKKMKKNRIKSFLTLHVRSIRASLYRDVYDKKDYILRLSLNLF